MRRNARLSKAICEVEFLERRMLMSVLYVTVTDSGDPAPSSSGTTLRQAINAVNQNEINFHQGGTITFSPSMTGGQTIALAKGSRPLHLYGGVSVDIKGDGTSVTIDGKYYSNIFQVDSGEQATISGLTITKGGTDKNIGNGGGIYNAGTLALVDCNISHSQAASGAGIFNNSGHLTITGGSISNDTAGSNGGGIYNNSGGTIDSIEGDGSGNVQINSDQALGGNGGGIFNAGTIGTVSNTQVNSDSASNNGGGISNSGTIGTLASVQIGNYTSPSVHVGDTAGGNGGGIYNTGSI